MHEKLSKATLLSHLDQYLQHHPIQGDLWIFAYGSLMWHPEITFCEQRRSVLFGYHRSFSLLSVVHRGTPEKPGLVLGLESGGQCEGMIFRVSAEQVIEQLQVLWLREMVTLFYQPVVCSVQTTQGTVNALTFVANTKHPLYASFRPEISARMIATARGKKGSNMDYFCHTNRCLQELGIQEPVFHQLQTLIDTITTVQS